MYLIRISTVSVIDLRFMALQDRQLFTGPFWYKQADTYTVVHSTHVD